MARLEAFVSTSGTASRLALALLAVALLAGTAVRIAGLTQKRTYTHDESISYLAATCHQGEYQRISFGHAPPFGSWVPAAAWQRLLEPERALCFGRIRADLALYDIHPPLYFWLLHAWVLPFGTAPASGAALNIVLALLGTLALYGLARRVLGEPRWAALVAFAWALSPAAIQVFIEARPYELLSLLSVLLVWQALRFADRRGREERPALGDAALLALVTAAGMLTHYYFALVAAGVCVLLASRLIAVDRRRLLLGLGSIGAGGLAFVAVHPDFWRAFGPQRAQAGGFVLAELPGRLEQVVATFGGFLLPDGAAESPAGWLSFALLVGATAWLCVGMLHSRRAAVAGAAEEAGAGGRDSLRGGAMVALLVWLAGATVLLYLTFIAHGLSMTPKYLSLVWPFCAFVPVLVLRRLGARPGGPAVLSFCCALLVLGPIAAFREPSIKRFPDPAPVTAGAGSVLVDNVARGVFPRIFRELPPDARVFAADQRYLSANRDAWLGPFAGASSRRDERRSTARERPPPDLSSSADRAIYITELPVSDVRYGNSALRGRELLDAIGDRYAVTPTGRGIWGLGQVYRIRQR